MVDKTYEPLPARSVTVPKSNGKMRELAILTVRDRVAQRAVLDAIEPLFEAQFLDCSFAFRPGRSVEMAVQRLIAARAHGFHWTVDADIQDFFPSIDHGILLGELSRTMDDADVLRLIKQWLDAGALEDERPRLAWLTRGRSVLTGASLMVRETIDQALDDLLAQRLGDIDPAADPLLAESDCADVNAFSDELSAGVTSAAPVTPSSPLRRTIVRRLIEDGLLWAVAERTLLFRLLSPKLLALGGGAGALAALMPAVVRALRERGNRRVGTLQGAPLSPLLANTYLHPFDETLTCQGYRLVRYCDDFVILCRSEDQARQVLNAAEEALADRRLQLHPEKTRLASPSDSFDFLGYHFAADGRVVPPPTIPEVIARQIVELTKKQWSVARDQWSEIGRRKTETRKRNPEDDPPETERPHTAYHI